MSQKSYRPVLERLEERALLSGGDLDPTFGSGGQVIGAFGPTVMSGANRVAVQPDGHIITTAFSQRYGTPGLGALDPPPNWYVIRFNADGSSDPSFQKASADGGDGFLVQPDGKIVLAGFDYSFSPPRLSVRRLNADGSIDSSSATAFDSRALGDIYGVQGGLALQPDGQLILALSPAHPPTGATTVALIRLDTDGKLDPTFGDGGKVVTPILGVAAGVAVQDDGKVVVAATAGVGASKDLAVLRFRSDGRFDATYGAGGLATAKLAPGDASGLVLQPDGKVLVTGTVISQGAPALGLARFNRDGTLDPTFGVGGKTISPALFKGHGVLQGDGKLVVAGTNGRTFAVARFDAQGGVDPTFGVNGVVTSHFGDDELLLAVAYFPPIGAADVALQPDGQIVVAGIAENRRPPYGSESVLARYLAEDTRSPSERFVARLYQELLHRSVDPSGLAFWSGWLDRGQSRDDVVLGIQDSLEYRTSEVIGVFHRLVHRDPEPAVLASWRDALRGRATVTQLEAVILGTDECFAINGFTPDNDYFLQALYEAVLERPIDPVGQQAWGQALQVGWARQDVALAILSSPEKVTRVLGDLYIRVLHRPADESGLNSFSQAILRGVSPDLVLAALLSSDEYHRGLEA